MKVIVITPPGPSTRTGNSVAALRWARILRRLGHRTTMAADYRDESVDAMVAIHAWRSADAVRRFKVRLLTGLSFSSSAALISTTT
jgi:hypothetical protein